MGTPALGITKGITSWRPQQHSVERVTDNIAYTTSHPDDTLVLAGPPRRITADESAVGGIMSLLAIGMMQTFQITSQKPTQPLAAIGSGRIYFVSGKSQSTWRIGRLFCNGRNLLRVLYHNCVAAGVDVSKFDDPAALTQYNNFFINLDSELFYVPFGLAALFRDKLHNKTGGFYCELAMLNTYTLGFTAGQNMIMEDVGGMCDRLLPYHASDAVGAGVPISTIDAAIGFFHGGQDDELYKYGAGNKDNLGLRDDNLGTSDKWP